MCAITPFGITGPHRDRPATHLTAFAHSGAMHRVGSPDTPPRPIPAHLHWHLAATHAGICILAALGGRTDVGGQFIDISAQEIQGSEDLQFEVYDRMGLRPGGRTVPIGIPPTGDWACRDGSVNIGAYQHRHWQSFLEMLDEPAELMEPSLHDMALRKLAFDGIHELIAPLMTQHAATDLVEKGQAAGLPISPINTPASSVRDPQFAARAFFEDIGHPDLGPLSAPGPAVRTSPRLFAVSRPAPRLGEHQAEILARDGSERSAPRSYPGPSLRGMRILTFGEFIAGSVAGQLLAGLGAEVVKIEARSHPSVLRSAAYNYGPALATEPSGATITATNASLNRGMQGLALEMGEPEGPAVFKRLVARADAVIENFGPSVTPGWGCSYEELLRINPGLIMASLSGFGRTGPRSSHVAYASNISAFTGLTWAWTRDGSLTDYLTGVQTALAIIAARAHTMRTGQGVRIDAAQTEVLTAMGASLYLGPLVNGTPDETPMIGDETSLLSLVFRCVGVDRWACVEITDADGWNAVCRVLDRMDLGIVDDQSAPRTGELEQALTEWAEPLTPRTVATVLTHAGVASAAVQDIEEVYHDPQMHHRHLPETRNHPQLGPITSLGSPHRLSKTPGRLVTSGPGVGEHSRTVLSAWIDMEPGEVDDLIARGAVYQAPIN